MEAAECRAVSEDAVEPRCRVPGENRHRPVYFELERGSSCRPLQQNPLCLWRSMFFHLRQTVKLIILICGFPAQAINADPKKRQVAMAQKYAVFFQWRRPRFASKPSA
jgi:hypothetical protein